MPAFASPSTIPDLKMSGSNSFMKIMESPEAIKKAMIQAAGGKE